MTIDNLDHTTYKNYTEYYIQGKYENELNNIYSELKKKHKYVFPQVYRFRGTAEYYGEFIGTNKKNWRI